MTFTLTDRAVSDLMEGRQVTSPVFQILGFKKISGAGGNDRYRLNISDGVHSHTFAMLATQLNHMIPEGKLVGNTIIRADKLISNSVSEKRVLIILELTILAEGARTAKIGNPVQWSEQNSTTNGNSSSNRPSVPQAQKPTNGYGDGGSSSVYGKPAAPANNAPNGNAGGGGGSYNRSSIGGGGPGNDSWITGAVMPIRDLTPYNNKCAIRARVTSKSDIRTWSNSKGEGKLFNIELLDDSGEVRMAGFNQSVEQFYDILEVNHVYTFKNFSVKAANRAFNKLSHDYELGMGNDTQIFPYLDDTSSIPTTTYNFVDIATIEGMDNDAFIDVIGICKQRGELVTFTSKAGKELKKRELVLVDKTNREINLTLWGKQADEFLDASQPVVCVKAAKVGDFQGKNISVVSGSSLMINPDIPEAHALRGWYDSGGSTEETKSLSGIRNTAGGSTPWKTLREAVSPDQADSDKPEYFMSKVTLMSVKRDNPLYMACPSMADAKTCNKKVVDQGNGMYRCEKCNRDFPEFKWRLMLSVNFADFSDNMWATCFQEAAEALLGHSSDVLGPMNTEDSEAFDAIIRDVSFKNYIVKCRSKLENFNNEYRRKTTVMEIQPVNFAEYARKLTAEIKESYL